MKTLFNSIYMSVNSHFKSSVRSAQGLLHNLGLVALFLMLGSLQGWGMTTSDIETSAATTITEGASYVIATAYNGTYLTHEAYADWGRVSTSINDAAIFTAYGSSDGFYLIGPNGRMTTPASGKYTAYDNESSINLKLNSSGQILNKTTEAINLRYNSTGFRWYNGTTGNSVYLFKIKSTYTITYNAGTGSCKASDSEASAGSGITLTIASPSASCAAAGWVFAGWKQGSTQAETTSIPTLISGGSLYHPHSNETLYAVYRLGDVYTIDFENTSDKYPAWTFTRIDSKQTNSYISAYGAYVGLTTATNPNSVETKSKIASPSEIRFKISKTTSNTTTSTWKVYTSTDGSAWTSIKEQSAISMAQGQWLEVSQDLSSYSDVYVKIEYNSSGAIRAIDDVILSCATFNSNPSCCDKLVELSAGTQTNATISSFSPSSVPTCSETASNRNVTITVAAAAGYEFTSSARLTYSGDGTATYISGPTGTGPYTFVYQFAQNDNGSGSFSVTSATPKTYTITYKDQGGGAFSGTQAGAPTTHTYGTATTLKIPTKFGHTFGGWFTASDCESGAVGTSSSATLGATDYTANITLYAKWTEKSLTNYRTSCCTDPELSFLDENEDPTTTYTIVREDLASASAAVEIDCNFGSLNTSSEFTWYSTSRAAKTFPETGATSRTTPSSQLSYMTIDMSNKTITASQTGIYTITIKQAGATISETVYCDAEAEVVVTVKTVDKFIDAVNGNFSGEAQRLEDVGGGILLPTEATFLINDACHLTTRRLLGWIKASDLNSYRTSGNTGYIDTWKTGDPATNKVIAPGTRVEATGVTWYAVWGEEVTP